MHIIRKVYIQYKCARYRCTISMTNQNVNISRDGTIDDDVFWFHFKKRLQLRIPLQLVVQPCKIYRMKLYIILIRIQHQIAQFKLTHFVCRRLLENDVSIIPRESIPGEMVLYANLRIEFETNEGQRESAPFSSTLHKQIRVTSSKVRCKHFSPTSWNYEILLATGTVHCKWYLTSRIRPFCALFYCKTCKT